MPEQIWPASLAGGNLDRYYHVCGFFNGPEEEYRVLLPFVREGLANHEKALHIWDPQQREQHVRRLDEAGIPVASRERDGQLAILSTHDVYLEGGSFNPDRMLTTFKGALAQGKAQGYSRMRILGHTDWFFEGHPGAAQFLEFEMKVNAVLAADRQVAVCVYDINKLSARLMMEILRAHPLTIVGGVLHENPFFTPPEEYLRVLAAQADGARAVA